MAESDSVWCSSLFPSSSRLERAMAACLAEAELTISHVSRLRTTLPALISAASRDNQTGDVDPAALVVAKTKADKFLHNLPEVNSVTEQLVRLNKGLGESERFACEVEQPLAEIEGKGAWWTRCDPVGMSVHIRSLLLDTIGADEYVVSQL